MKTVMIPNDYHPFVIEVNGVKYTYPEGTEQSVPDEVASAIENYYKLQPKERPTDGGVLPYVSGENNGEVLTVKDGAWTSANGGLSESDFVMNGNDLAGFNTDEGKIYLPVFPDTGYWLEKIGDGGITLKRNTDLYVSSEATGSQYSRQAIAYEHKGVRYVLSAAMVGSLILSGAAEESINIPAGAPTKLWDSVIVAVGSAELYCRRLSPESATTAAYQGFVSSETDFGEGIFRLDMGVEKSGTSTYTFSLSFKKASGSGGGGDSDVFTMHLSYDDDQETVMVTEDAVDISNAISAGKVLRIAFYASSPDYNYDGYVMPFSYYTDGVYDGVATGIYIALTDPVNWRDCNLSYYNSAWQIQGI